LVLRKPANTPLITINLLKFREVAAYAPNEDGATMKQVSGKEAYETRYVPVSKNVLKESGAQFEVIYRGRMVSHLIGPTADEVCFLVCFDCALVCSIVGRSDDAAVSESRRIDQADGLSELRKRDASQDGSVVR
jgi:hypothetical protein